jgi:predicted nucleotidyltransferase component of viral defense system
MLEKILQDLVREKKEENLPDFLIINFLKEYLQYPVLNFIYKNEKYRNLIFTGGSCLRICHDLPRLSEDLDFDLEKKDFDNLDLENLEKELTDYFKKQYSLEIKTRRQDKRRLYLKFPILHQLGLNLEGGSDFLYVKIEPSLKQFKNFSTEIQAVSNYGYNFIVKKYPLKELMTGKLIAVFNREWFKGANNEIDIKGRDFYDLFWYFQNEIEPDYETLKKALEIKDKKDLKTKLKQRIEKQVTPLKLKRDLQNFLPDQKFAEDFCNNYEELTSGYLR